jgi:hypothetical protein
MWLRWSPAMTGAGSAERDLGGAAQVISRLLALPVSHTPRNAPATRPDYLATIDVKLGSDTYSQALARKVARRVAAVGPPAAASSPRRGGILMGLPLPIPCAGHPPHPRALQRRRAAPQR